MIITEMIPQNEALDTWTEMLTTQVFLGLKNATPQQFRDLMQKQWLASCKGGESASIAEGHENGYPFAVWIQACPANRKTGKPEKTWLKAIKGTDSFYIVQKAFRFDPSAEQITKWVQYLKSVQVCDTRLEGSPCPDLARVSR
ncbi:hypothetical protein [Noviherbaspirillum sp.]|uniref:hypothetical protein n=1 Tax=Noviherbaspirillum sp. TaxID=1926288 RepID=UPI002D78C9C7|nr:hypothetical protein [Noviherbaspirillum sp.]